MIDVKYKILNANSKTLKNEKITLPTANIIINDIIQEIESYEGQSYRIEDIKITDPDFKKLLNKDDLLIHDELEEINNMIINIGDMNFSKIQIIQHLINKNDISYTTANKIIKFSKFVELPLNPDNLAHVSVPHFIRNAYNKTLKPDMTPWYSDPKYKTATKLLAPETKKIAEQFLKDIQKLEEVSNIKNDQSIMFFDSKEISKRLDKYKNSKRTNK